jgi:hypothetical protein
MAMLFQKNILNAHFVMSHLIVWAKLWFLTLFIIIYGLNFYKSLGIYCDSF